MRKSQHWSAALWLVLLSCLSSLPLLAHADADSEAVPGEILVGVRAGTVGALQANSFNDSVGVVLGYHPTLHAYRLRMWPGLSLDAALAHLRQRADVTYAEPNYIRHMAGTPNDPSYSSNQYGPQITQANLAWDIWTPKATAVIAIVDTGIDYNHSDLANKLLKDANGAVVGFNELTNSPSAIDDNGHGTHCAGIAAAQINNGVGIAGIAGWDGNAAHSDTSSVKLMPVKVLDSTGSGSDAAVAAGITWAADHGANVISMSLGGPSFSDTINNAVQYAWGKGCVIVAAAGNSGSTAPSYPGANANVISVAATDRNDTLTYFSNYGSWVSVAAPGDNIYSTYKDGGYQWMSGTSMATPHVAGEAALLLAQKPSLTNSQLVTAITTNVDPYTPYAGHTIATGSGRINIYRALKSVGAGPPNAAQFVSQSVPTSMTAGQTYSVTVTMMNTGTNTWTTAGQYKLGSQNPQDNSTWGTGRVNVSGSVAYGQTATFTFNVTAPSTPGTYNFQWRMLQEGVQWFGDYTPNVAVTVTSGAPTGPPLAAQFVSQSIPSSMTAGQSYSIQVVMKNTGSNTWTAASFYRLGSQNPQDNRTWGIGRAELPGSTSPGSIATFNFTVTAPAAPGQYNMQWRMVEDGVAWFGDLTPSVAVNVTAGGQTPPPGTPAYAAQFVSQSVPTSMTAGQTVSVTLTMMNTGTNTWTAAGQYKLGSQNPQDNGTWGTGRVNVPGSVAYGQTATFTFNVTAPTTPGTYNFQWRMLQEGVQWFGDYTPNIAVKVQ